MATPNFFNENINRSFPFQRATVGVDTPTEGYPTMLQLPDNFIADCGFILGPESGFIDGTHSVFLYKISRISNSTIEYEFHSDAPNLADSFLLFRRDITDPIYQTEFIESDVPFYTPVSQSLSLSISVPIVICGEPYWSGYLVTGPIEAVTARLEVGDIIYRESNNEAIVEPALIQNLNQSQVVSLNLANVDRTRAARPANCPPNSWAFPTGQNYVLQECLQGDIRLQSGYNMAITQNSNTNTIQFAARVNAGLGEPCTEFKLFPQETPPTGASNNLLAGDYYCNETLRSINGLQGPSVTLLAGVGVSIFSDNAKSTVTINVNLNDLQACSYSTVSETI
jgi:hypothetical protein